MFDLSKSGSSSIDEGSAPQRAAGGRCSPNHSMLLWLPPVLACRNMHTLGNLHRLLGPIATPAYRVMQKMHCKHLTSMPRVTHW
jgi:hypothetical protein